MKSILKVLVGLPASGKSTEAKILVGQGWIRTNKDTIREELFPDYKRKDEKKVVKERNRQIIEALSQGKNVVVDDTNLNPIHVRDLANIAKEYDADFEVDRSFLDVPLSVCIKRDKNREKSVGEQVIRGMFHQYIKKAPTAIEYDSNLPMAIICDIDGTLAHMGDRRKPFEWHKVGLDEVDLGVAHLIDAINCIGYAEVFLFSGRNEVCRPETEEWLERNAIEYKALYMRPQYNPGTRTESNADDRDIKRDMLFDNIIGYYNVLFVVDDRPKVCRMWRDEFGFRVLNVGDPYYEF
jgi:predicted kinase